MKSLIDTYKSTAQSIGLVADKEGFLSTLLPGSDTPKPWMIDKKRIVLPVENQLQHTDWSGRIGFHPLLQNVALGDSKVLEKFRDRMNSYADFTVGMLFHDIGKLALQKTMHQDMSPAQAAYLGPFADADAGFVKLLYDLVTTNRISKKDHEFVRFSVIKGRVWDGQKRSRVAGMHFPLYEKLPTDGKGTTFLNFKLRQKDVKMLRAMFQMLFPFIDSQQEREFGSDSKIGPSFEALMTIYGKFAAEINKAVSILEPVIESSTALLIVDDWRDEIASVEKLWPEIRQIPMLEGNTPSERVAQLAAPQRVGESVPAAATQPTATAFTAPVIAASALPTPSTQQGTTPVQQAPAVRPPFKLGSPSPTVSDSAITHKLPDNVGNGPAVIGYSRPVHSSLPPTPPVGALLAQQQQSTQPQALGQTPFGHNNVLGAQVGQSLQPLAQGPQAVKIPESARMVNNVMYIPLESHGVSAAPAGAIVIEGKLYVPFGQVGGAPVNPMGQTTVFAPPANRFGNPQQQLVDPASVPGLSQDEINYYRSNPVVWQTVLANMQQATMATATAAAAQRQIQVPRYLQNAVQNAQQQQQSAMGFFPRGMR